MTEAPLTSVDLRTRFDDRPEVVDPVAFLDRELPELLVRHDELLASTEHLDLRPLVVRTEHGRWLLERVGTSLGLTPMHITGIISAVAASVEPITEDPADRP